jgi:hypothetical protein
MLYLFGRLALSDSLSYHENFLDDDYAPGTAWGTRHEGPGPDARAAAVSRRLRRGRHFPQPGRASAGRVG